MITAAQLIESLNAISELATDPAEVIDAAINIYKACKCEIGGFEEVQKAAKKQIEETIILTGLTDWTTPAGRVYFPKPGVTIKYDTKALDALCASSPELKAILWPHRSEVERAGAMTIK